ncbi:MAG TPA: D-alanine--D-alanine ligase [Candidatus Uhrbacteria bacterium]|nr:D-alanine--D-alanine ligase [Candidatus Uhrbacteria bacterium]
MQNNMLKIGLIFGGLSNEHEVSIISAQNIAANFDIKKYAPVLIFWNKNGGFFCVENFKEVKIPKKQNLVKIEDFKKYFDIAFPITHGKYGEDGVLQAILESQRIKYCGCRVLSSALCMDKAVFKQFVEGQKIKQVKFKIIIDNKLSKKELKEIKREFILPIFVKPANSGSSVGITKVKNLKNLYSAIKIAFQHDNKVIIEQGIEKPREIEIAILGNKNLIVSEPGELKPFNEFYDYNDKYKLNKTKVTIPAKLNKKQIKEIKEIAGRVYRICCCTGFARVDFLLKDNKIYLNEINTLPGFTQNSMYPLLMMNKGMSYKQLINRIIELAS